MTGETLERVAPKKYRCTECGAVSKTRLPNHDLNCPVIQDDWHKPNADGGDR